MRKELKYLEKIDAGLEKWEIMKKTEQKEYDLVGNTRQSLVMTYESAQ